MRNIFAISAFMLIVTALHGQKIVKGTFFSAHALGVCNDTTGLIRIALDEPSSTLNIYSWTGLYGEIDLKFDKSEDKGKSAKTKVGNFMKRAEAYNNAQNNNERAPDIGCLVARKLTFEDLMSSPDFPATVKGAREFYSAGKKIPYDRLNHVTVYAKKMRKDAEYSFQVSDYEKCGGEQVNLNKIKMITPEALQAAYPDLMLGVPVSSFEMLSKGEGLLGNKNLKTYIAQTDMALEVDSVWSQIRWKNVKTEKPDMDKNVAKTNGYSMFYRERTLELNKDTRFSILRQTTEDDKWGIYRSFKLVKYNSKGEILNATDVKPEFLKDINFFGFTYDKAGQPSGVILVLSSFTAIGGKSSRDPKDNNHFLYYFGLDGSEQFHVAVEHGSGDNPRGINPMLVTDEAGTLTMWNMNYEKMFKPRAELLVINSKGKGEVKAFEMGDMESAMYNMVGHGTGSKVIPVGNGQLLVYNGTEAKPDDSGKIPANGAIFAALVTTDFKILASKYFTHAYTRLPKMDYLGVINGGHKMVVTTHFRNYFISLGGEKSGSMYFPNEETVGVYLSRDILDKNYVYDQKSNKIYAIYQHGTGNGLGYILAIEP